MTAGATVLSPSLTAVRELPLVSTLYINHVRSGFNGSVLSCGEGRGDDPATSANTTVFIVGNNPGELRVMCYSY